MPAKFRCVYFSRRVTRQQRFSTSLCHHGIHRSACRCVVQRAAARFLLISNVPVVREYFTATDPVRSWTGRGINLTANRFAPEQQQPRQLQPGRVSTSQGDVELFRGLASFLGTVQAGAASIRQALPLMMKLAQKLLARGARPDVMVRTGFSVRVVELSWLPSARLVSRDLNRCWSCSWLPS